MIVHSLIVRRVRVIFGKAAVVVSQLRLRMAAFLGLGTQVFGRKIEVWGPKTAGNDYYLGNGWNS
jgi:hypothetical protein